MPDAETALSCPCEDPDAMVVDIRLDGVEFANRCDSVRCILAFISGRH
jgi:hypothetical protein